MKSILKTTSPSGLADTSPNFGSADGTSQFGLVESIPKTDSFFMPYYKPRMKGLYKLFCVEIHVCQSLLSCVDLMFTPLGVNLGAA